MLKIDMTEEIGSKLKELRISKNIKSKDVAAHINKTAAYYSKLEKAVIKTIEKDCLKEILNFITNSTDGYSLFMESIASESTSEELNSNLWLLNFDTVERIIPVPKTLIEEINNLISIVNIDTPKLIEFINSNEDLEKDFLNKNNITLKEILPNRWYEYDHVTSENKTKAAFIYVELNIDTLEELLTYHADTSNWLTIYSTIYHLLKLQQKQNISNDFDIETIKIDATNIMIHHKFYSLSDRCSLAQQAKTEDEYNELLSEFDKQNREYVNIILSAIAFISDYDVMHANKLLKQISQNIETDSSFALRFMATNLTEMKNLSVTSKKNYLIKVDELTEKTKNDETNHIDIFD